MDAAAAHATQDAQPVEAGAAEEAHDHCLGLVVAVVTGGDGGEVTGSAGLLEEVMAQFAGGVLEATTALAGQATGISRANGEGNVEAGAEIRAEVLVAVAAGAAEIVVEVGGGEGARTGAGPGGGGGKQGHRVGSAGEGNEEAGCCRILAVGPGGRAHSD